MMCLGLLFGTLLSCSSALTPPPAAAMPNRSPRWGETGQPVPTPAPLLAAAVVPTPVVPQKARSLESCKNEYEGDSSTAGMRKLLACQQPALDELNREMDEAHEIKAQLSDNWSTTCDISCKTKGLPMSDAFTKCHKACMDSNPLYVPDVGIGGKLADADGRIVAAKEKAAVAKANLAAHKIEVEAGEATRAAEAALEDALRKADAERAKMESDAAASEARETKHAKGLTTMEKFVFFGLLFIAAMGKLCVFQASLMTNNSTKRLLHNTGSYIIPIGLCGCILQLAFMLFWSAYERVFS
jgi:nucleoid-associated protein YgaU